METDISVNHEPLVVGKIFLDFTFKAQNARIALNQFVQKYQRELALESDDLLQEYCTRLWPGTVPSSMIICASSFDQYDRWILRPPADGPMASQYGAAGLAPAFSAYRKQAVLVIDGCCILPHVPPRMFERYVSGTFILDSNDNYIQSNDLVALSSLPRPRKKILDAINSWLEYLDWRQKLVFISQVWLRYDNFEIDNAGMARFTIMQSHEIGRITHQRGIIMFAAAAHQSRQALVWDPDPINRPKSTPIGELVSIKVLSNKSNDRKLLVTIKPDSQYFEADLKKALPPEGFLLSAVGSEMAPIGAQRRTINRLIRNQHHNWYLPEYFFDINNVSIPSFLIEPQLEGNSFNRDQRQAIIKIINASDIALLLGPPGTGKTTVIAAVAAWLVSAGLRVLIASQTNVAVDNVLLRMAADPAIRPLRVGNEERIMQDSRIFTLPQALGAWYKAINTQCNLKMKENQKYLESIQLARQSLNNIESAAFRLESLRKDAVKLEALLHQAQAQKELIDKNLRQLDDSYRQYSFNRRLLTDIIAWTNNPTENVTHNFEFADNGPVYHKAEDIAKHIALHFDSLPWKSDELGLAPGQDSRNVFDPLSRFAQICSHTTTLANGLDTARKLCSQQIISTGDEYKELIRRRQMLILSDSQDDIAELVSVNRSIRRIIGNQWSQVCQLLGQILDGIFIHLPDNIFELVSSLEPAGSLIPVIAMLDTIVSNIDSVRQNIFEPNIIELKKIAQQELSLLSAKIDELDVQRRDIQSQIDELSHVIADTENEIENNKAQVHDCVERCRIWWQNTRIDSTESIEFSNDFGISHYEKRRDDLNAWLEKNVNAIQRATLWFTLQKEWIDLLSKPYSGSDKNLQPFYARKANIIGCTCYEASQKSFYDNSDFEPFDVVIIDEVSKATPVELLGPMLLGRKIVLVGDHHQLGPMFKERETSFAEALEAGVINREDFERFGKLVTASTFEFLFTQAPEILRHNLSVQYRMHPQIMAVINQFYHNTLQIAASLEEADHSHQHHLEIPDRCGGYFLKPDQHVLWVDSSRDKTGRPVWEKQAASSKINLLEAQLIVESLDLLNHGLTKLGYRPPIKCQLNDSQMGMSAYDIARTLMPDARHTTVDDLFARKAVRAGCHPIAPSDIMTKPIELEIDARMPIGVITFYGAQLGLIRRNIAQALKMHPAIFSAIKLATNTVDLFQGMEMPIVLVSLVRSSPHRNVGEFVKQYKRINVAFSRAQNLLVIIGAYPTFCNACVQLPLDNEQTGTIPVYKNIHDIVTKFGGRRYAQAILRT